MFTPERIQGYDDAAITLTAPENWDETIMGKCENLPATRTQNGFASQWRLTWLQRIKVLFTGRIYLHLLADAHPPVCLTEDFPLVREK